MVTAEEAGGGLHMTEDSARREFQIKEKEEIHRSSGFLCTSGLSEREVHVCGLCCPRDRDYMCGRLDQP